MDANQSQSEESRRTREVRFDDSPEEVSVEYPTFETDDVWYSWEEVRSMIAVQHADVLRISNAFAMAPAAHVTNDQRIEMRGLDAFIPPVVWRRSTTSFYSYLYRQTHAFFFCSISAIIFNHWYLALVLVLVHIILYFCVRPFSLLPTPSNKDSTRTKTSSEYGCKSISTRRK